MHREDVNRLLVVLAAPRVLGLPGTALRSLPTELLPALRLMVAYPPWPTPRYINIKHVWKMLNPGAGGQLGDFDQFRASHGWVRGAMRPDKLYMQERSYQEAKEVYLKSVHEAEEKQAQFELDHPDYFMPDRERVRGKRMRDGGDPVFQVGRNDHENGILDAQARYQRAHPAAHAAFMRGMRADAEAHLQRLGFERDLQRAYARYECRNPEAYEAFVQRVQANTE